MSRTISYIPKETIQGGLGIPIWASRDGAPSCGPSGGAAAGRWSTRDDRTHAIRRGCSRTDTKAGSAGLAAWVPSRHAAPSRRRSR